MVKIPRISPESGRGKPLVSWLLLLLVLLSLVAVVPSTAAEPLRNAPVIWYADDRQPIPVPAFAEPGLVPCASQAFVAGPVSRFFRPSRLVRKLDDGYAGRPAGDVNSLGEVINSTWFTNRIGLYPLDPAEVARGPGQPEGPDRSRPWEIIGAKVGGVTPGFRIRDGRGDVWLLKFDPPDYPGMSTRSGVVSNLLFHAMGYNTPVDRVVFFTLDDLRVGEGATMRLPRAGKVPLTEANLESVLRDSNCREGDHYVALASKFLAGKPLGPFRTQGRRADDPNDRIRHENRRTLRALRVFAAWLNHFDTKMHNSLDMYVGEPGSGYVEHNLIDFASTLGTFGATPVKRFGYEYGIDAGNVVGRLMTLGLVEDGWVCLERPEGLPEVGYFDVETFDPTGWEPDIPHSAMGMVTGRPRSWPSSRKPRSGPRWSRAGIRIRAPWTIWCARCAGGRRNWYGTGLPRCRPWISSSCGTGCWWARICW